MLHLMDGVFAGLDTKRDLENGLILGACLEGNVVTNG